jgi:type I restriction enzyme S subunit
MSTAPKTKVEEVETGENGLPEGWAAAQLSDLVSINYGKGLKESDRLPGNVPVYGSNGIVGKHNRSLTKGQTLVIGRKGTVGAVHLSSVPCWPIDTTYFVDEFHELSARFLAAELRTLNLSDLDTSTAIPGVNRDDLYGKNTWIAPLCEQERIASRIEELEQKAALIGKRLGRIRIILKQFRQAVLAAACSGKLTEDWRDDASIQDDISETDLLPEGTDYWPEIPKSWRMKNIKGVCEVIVDCPHSTPKWTDKGEICLRTTNFRPGILDLSEVRFVSEQTYTERVARLTPACDDVLYSREGGILGIACLFPQGVKACLGQRMMLMRTDRSVMLPVLMMHILNSEFTTGHVRELTTGSASPHLNVGDIKSFATPVPPIAEQAEIVRRVEVLFKLADAIEKRVAAASLRAERLTQAILAKAFRGELVPTEAELARREGREYEPAAVLLERIKKERSRQTIHKNSHRSKSQ